MTETMIIEQFTQLITPDLYIFIAAVYGLCFALKKAAFFNDRFIPLAAVAFGVALELAYISVSGGNIVEAICKGIIVGIAAVFVANVIKQIKRGGNKGE